MSLSRSPLWPRGFARPRSPLGSHISSKLQQLHSNRAIQTFAWTRRPKIGDLERSRLLQHIVIVGASLPSLAPSSKIIRRRQLFGRGSQRPNLIWRASIYTGCLIGLSTAFTMAYWAADARGRMRGKWVPFEFIERNFICSVNNVKSGRWWVVLTSSFAHYNPVHLMFNMEALWYIGRLFISLHGASAFVGTWLVCAITGSLGSLYWERHQNRDNMSTTRELLGSSTAILGLMFAQSTFMPYTLLRAPIGEANFPAWRFCAFIFGASVYSLYSGFLPWIGHAGHLGGMAGGVAAYFVFLRRMFRR
ncbi:hypothetical protein JMJ35_000475 [Cladonia borealis]|uniref:Peptidase S54 rhomboid domain-containing protein n=1 Tax=Cladonia borealis TaxID=184061 RepID=A0AA39VA29_9LECA|nr:hypothetical protein JMJ35_000475 [Cladonia borealis]